MRFAECAPAPLFTSTPRSSSPTTCTVCGRCRKTMPIFRVGGERSRPGSRNRCRSASSDHRSWRAAANAAFGSGGTGSTRSATIATLRLKWTIRISTRSSMVSWRTRRTGRIRHFAGASPAECIPPTGGAAAINRNRRANGSEIEGAEAGRGTRPLHWPRAPTHKSRRNALRSSALRLLCPHRRGKQTLESIL